MKCIQYKIPQGAFLELSSIPALCDHFITRSRLQSGMPLGLKQYGQLDNFSEKDYNWFNKGEYHIRV